MRVDANTARATSEEDTQTRRETGRDPDDHESAGLIMTYVA